MFADCKIERWLLYKYLGKFVFVIVMKYCIRHVKFDMEVNYIYSNILYDIYCYLKDMRVSFANV